MDNKELGPDVPQASHNEKDVLGAPPDNGGPRRGSTAVNIVENPLKVSLAISWPLGLLAVGKTSLGSVA
jgi:hypothetical protein